MFSSREWSAAPDIRRRAFVDRALGRGRVAGARYDVRRVRPRTLGVGYGTATRYRGHSYRCRWDTARPSGTAKFSRAIDPRGQISFYNGTGKLLLAEYMRLRLGNMQAGTGQIDEQAVSYFNSALKIHPRTFTPQVGGDYALSVRFESAPDEKIYGMGGYQHGFLDHKGCLLELAQRNSQASVPFAVSSLGYGFLWNNPAIGFVSFGKNLTEWSARSTRQLDYWITAGRTARHIVENYAKVTGTVPMMPEYGLGLWQSKLRYRTQDELLCVAREYRRRGIHLDVIVVDFFHWPKQGEYCFDPDYWPDPESMIAELEAMGTKLMVSIWPTIDKTSTHFEEMCNQGLLVRSHRGIATTMDFLGETVFFDATNPQARDYIWRLVKENYYDKGVRIFWLDEAEPEYSVYDFDNYRYYAGTDLQVGNIYPRTYAQGFYEGMSAQGPDWHRESSALRLGGKPEVRRLGVVR